MAQVAVRIIQTYDALVVEADYGDSDEEVLARATTEGITPTETRILIGRVADIEAAMAIAEADKPAESDHSRSGVWSPSEMSAEDYDRRKADLARNPDDESAKSDIAAYEAANGGK